MPEAVLSPEKWDALKMANLAGVDDKPLSEQFGVTCESIRQRRFRDPVWKAAMEARNSVCNSAVTQEPEKAELAQKAASTIQEAIQGGKLQNELLLLQIASKGLKKADENLPQVKQWSDIKAIADIVSKIGPQAQTAVQVNVLTDGQAQFSAFEFPSFESEPLDIENVE
jgi:hypothetical protein